MTPNTTAIHSHHKRIAAGALLIGVLTLVAKLFVAGREVAIAWRYGVSSTVDAYQLAITATTWVPMILAGVMTSVLVPRLVSLQRRGEDRQRFMAELNGSVLVLGIALTALTWLAAPYAATLLASPANPKTLQLTAELTAEMAPIALLMIMSGYFSARLQSRERYGYSVTEAVPAFAIALLVVASWAGADTWPLVVGTLVGYILQVAVLGGLVERGDRPLGRVRLRHRSDEWKTLRGSFLLMILGQLLIATSIPTDQAFAARLGEGAVATLGYANRIIGLFSGIGTIVVARALLPVLSEAVADGHLVLGQRHASQWALLLGGAATVGSAVVWVIAPDLVRIMFERGAFTAEASAEVTTVLRFGLLQLPFYFAGIALVQWISASGRYGALFAIAFVALVVKIVMNLLLIHPFGLAGLMAATATMYAVSFLGQLAFVMRKND